jgi:alkylation response protein AidB-like acyl-CoA dehydrogenase
MSADPEETESSETADFRREVRAWIQANQPGDPGFKLPQSFLEVESDRQFDYLRDWQRKSYEAGYLGVDWPEAYGGGGRPGLQRIVGQEMARAHAPFFVNTIGLQWAGPTILHYGTEAQKRRMLKPLLSAEEIWCQGFSEPGAGSDLASVQTRAVPSENGWLVTGHKVWTTIAHKSKWMILLARTDPDVNKYEGLSYFLMPMDVAGVTVQPLIKMSGEGGFNQVIFDEAPMPRDALLGELGQGWQVAMTTLLHERGAADGSGGAEIGSAGEAVRRVAALAARVQRDGRPAVQDPVLRDRMAELWIREEALRLGSQRARVEGLCRERPLALRMMNKLVFSEFAQDLADLACQLEGPAAQLWLGDANAPDRAEWPRAYMNSFGMTIGGGTSEIQRNILGERVLGLPKSK